MKTVNHYEHNKSYYLLLISCCWPLSLLADDFFIVSSTHSGAIQCSKPILRSCIPSLCPAHVQKTEKAIKQALKMGGLSVSSSAKLASKFQCITSEYVRIIQNRRRAAAAEARCNRKSKIADLEVSDP